ncbi:putative vestitone reductase [Rosa chinensis]|uniref:Putative vestitone reductase n=1 Tax=Rosa chinensis TaxID=74649 RepID=A0A2P6SG01_ROSCH|nr:putative vestitone reductase [Rosa chinensis]
MEQVKSVTGGTGFIGSWLVMKLLQHGYPVRPDPECKRDISYLTSLPRASEKLQIFNADLDQPESFNEEIEGCMHRGLPYMLLILCLTKNLMKQ